MIINEDTSARENKIKKASKYFGQLYNDAYRHISQLTKQLPDSIKEGLILDSQEIVSETNTGNSKAEKLATLQENINKMKGRKTNHEDRLKKKKLKNKLKKKLKSQEKIKTTKKVKKEVINSEDESKCSLTFNKIDFSDVEPKKKKYSKMENRARTEKDPAKALERMKKFRDKVKELKEGGEGEKAKELIKSESWKSAILKAEGFKVKDNFKLLKKTIKKKENTKKKSQQEWKDRKDKLEKKKMDAQKKRKENIIKHKKDKKDKKIKRSIKKGRVVL